jgi:hypothetical protein
MLPKIFRPIEVSDLIRLGNKFDGGYVVSKSIFKKTKQLITFGLFNCLNNSSSILSSTFDLIGT